jgi:RNase P/RNase MRP subunit p30
VKRFDLIYVSSFYPDTALMREVSDEKKAFEIPISGLLRSYGFSRAALLGRMRFFLSLCIKHNADYVLTSRAENAMEMKSVDEMIAIGYALGLTPPQVKRSLGVVAESIAAKASEK